MPVRRSLFLGTWLLRATAYRTCIMGCLMPSVSANSAACESSSGRNCRCRAGSCCTIGLYLNSSCSWRTTYSCNCMTRQQWSTLTFVWVLRQAQLQPTDALLQVLRCQILSSIQSDGNVGIMCRVVSRASCLWTIVTSGSIAPDVHMLPTVLLAG